MDALDLYLQGLRKKALSRRRPSGAVGFVVDRDWYFDHPLGHQTGARIAELGEDDLVVNLCAPDLLADRTALAQSVLKALLRGEHGTRYMSRLRMSIPSRRRTVNFLVNEIGMNNNGARCVADALDCGDFDAIMTLTTPATREAKDEFDQIHMRSEFPLSESQSRLLCGLLLRNPPEDLVHWIVLSGVEELASGASPAATSFRTGLKAWLSHFAPMRQNVILIQGWSGGFSRVVSTIEPTLQYNALWLEGASAEDEVLFRDPDPVALARGLVRLTSLPLSEVPSLPLWMGLGEERALMLYWAPRLDDPARWVAHHTGSLLERVSLRCPVVLPAWAQGDIHRTSRSSLARAYRQLRWIGLSRFEACALVELGNVPKGEELGEDSPFASCVDQFAGRLGEAFLE